MQNFPSINIALTAMTTVPRVTAVSERLFALLMPFQRFSKFTESSKKNRNKLIDNR